MKEYEVRVELVAFYKVEDSDHEHANEQAIELFLDDLADPKNREMWRGEVQAEARE